MTLGISLSDCCGKDVCYFLLFWVIVPSKTLPLGTVGCFWLGGFCTNCLCPRETLFAGFNACYKLSNSTTKSTHPPALSTMMGPWDPRQQPLWVQQRFRPPWNTTTLFLFCPFVFVLGGWAIGKRFGRWWLNTMNEWMTGILCSYLELLGKT